MRVLAMIVFEVEGGGGGRREEGGGGAEPKYHCNVLSSSHPNSFFLENTIFLMMAQALRGELIPLTPG